MRVRESSAISEVIKNFPISIFHADKNLDIIFLNDVGKEKTGYTESDINQGLNAYDIFVVEEHDEIKEKIQSLTQGNKKKFYVQNVRKKDRTSFPVEIYAIPQITKDELTGFWGIAVDISQRKAMEAQTKKYSEQLEEIVEARTKELKDSEKKFRFLAEQMNDIIWTMNMDLKTTYVSPSVEKILGYTPEERKKQTVMEQLTPDSLENVFKLLSEELIREKDEQYEPDRSISVEVEYYHKDGSTRWCENVISGIRDEAGELVGLHGVSRDISERKKTDEKLLESIKWSRNIFNGVIDAIFIVDTELNYIDVNTAAVRLTQYSFDELSEMKIQDIHWDKSEDRFNEYFEHITKGETIRDYSEIHRKDGEKVPVDYRISGITIQDETYLLLVANDLTLRKRYQERLEALYEIALQMAEANSVEAVAELCLSAINDVLRYNLCTLSMVEEDYLKFKFHKQENFVEELPLEGTGITIRAVRTGEIQLVPDVSKDPDYVPCNDRVICSELAVPVKVDSTVRALINVESQEINAFTEEDRDHIATLAELISNALHRLDTKEYLERLVEERTLELKKLNDQLVQLGEMKNQFINQVTHELRTPLTSIKGYLEIIETMKNEDILASRDRFFTIISRNTDRLVSLTNDLIEQQRLDSQKLLLETAPTYLLEIIKQAIENISPMMHYKKQTISVTHDETIPILTIDPIRIGQVLDNLLSNSIKYSDPGTHIIVKTENNEDKIMVSIKDEGIGLSEEDMRELFKPFPAIKKPITNENSTGLGLSICKGIIELHGGKIWAESEGQDKGSVFIFTIPKKPKIVTLTK